MSARAGVGQFRNRLTIESPIDTPDDIGGVSRTWAANGFLWASIRPLRMAQSFDGARPAQVVTHHIEFRRRDGLTTAARLRLGARVFRILAIEDLDASTRFQRALCEEVGP